MVNKKFWCFMGVHEYNILESGQVVDGGAIVGIWTFSTCKICGKTKYKQNC